ncbi:hypothetical protein [Polymorphospora sp. NPDC050346]|uniref:hypothetical protein n=1 Tax=Polymorphospora sp. NPDC050346 TaxID=3155780 RepID=UPI0033F607C7
MLFRSEVLDGIRRGTVSVVFRRWRQPRVRAGSRLRTAIGLVEIRSIGPVDEREVSDAEARRAGYRSAEALRADLPGSGDLRLFRIGVGYAGPDPREALREQDQLGVPELAALTERLARFDRAGARGAWTATVLRIIAEHPARRAAELAELAGYPATEVFKRDVRKLKELGLTESLETGYRLSPRGRAVVDRLD